METEIMCIFITVQQQHKKKQKNLANQKQTKIICENQGVWWCVNSECVACFALHVVLNV